MDAPRRFLLHHREPLRRACVVAALGVPLAVAGVSLFVDGWAARRFLILYTAPLTIAVCAWVRLRLDALYEDAPRALAVDASAVALAAMRFAHLPVPFSGHMLFLVHSALTTPSAPYRMLALLLMAETSWFKLVLWRDPRSWALGIAAGAALAATRILIPRSHGPPSAAP